jgi:deoxyribonuclease IV
MIQKTYRIGLKLWSTNDFYINEAIALYDEGVYQYIELYAVPDSFRSYISCWKKIDIPFVIHAPHSDHGMNLSDSTKWRTNSKLSEEALRYADELKADKIIFHPGINGEITENVNQINRINDPRIVIENMPCFTLDKLGLCNGSCQNEIKFILDNSPVGFCLDIGHAICAANAVHADPLKYISELIMFKPIIYHLSDGDYCGLTDEHKHFGEGSFQFEPIMAKIKDGAWITLETPKEKNNSLHVCIEDVAMFNEIVSYKRNSIWGLK